MLNPEQISNAQFTLVGKGAYRAEEVDAFLKSTAASYGEVAAQNSELMKKISILADRIEQYRAEEDTIKSALIAAERTAKTVRQEAEDEKAAIIASAQAESSEIIEAARKNAKDFVDKTKVTVAAYVEKAQTDTDAAISTANETAANTIADANKKAAEIIGDSEEKLAYYTAEATRLKAEIETYKVALSEICEKQLSLLNEIPDAPVINDYAVEEVVEVEEPADEVTVEEETVVSDSLFEDVEEEKSEQDETSEEESFISNSFDELESLISKTDESGESEELEPETEIPAEEEPAFALEDDISSDSISEGNDDFSVEITESDDDSQDDDFTGFKINLDDISDEEDSDDNQSLFSGFFDD